MAAAAPLQHGFNLTSGMWGYALLLLLPAVWAMAPRLPRRAAGMLPAASWILLTLFLGLRYQVGGDWDNYLRLFRADAAAGPLAAVLQPDPAYHGLNWLAAAAGSGLWAVNLTCAALFAGGLIMWARAQERPALALLIATPVMIMILAVSFTRQSAAIGLLLVGLALAAQGRRRVAAALIAAAPLFHWSALLLLPMAPLLLVRRVPPIAFLSLALAAAVATAALLLTRPELAGSVAPAGQARGALLRAAPTALALIVYALGHHRLPLRDTEHNAALWLAVLAGLAIAAVPAMPTAADRIGHYAVPFQMLVFARAPSLLEGAARRAAALAIAAGFALLFLLWLGSTSYQACFTPYRSYLFEPGRISGAEPEELRASSTCQSIQDSS